MRFGSVCSGIEAASVAWGPLGFQASFLSEIDAFPRAVLQHHYPDVPCHGDFTTIGAGDYGPIDLLVGGTPCQSFSVAGLRGGLADKRGNLALEFLRLADRPRPCWIVWENVPGVLSSTSHDAPDPSQPPDDMAEGSEWVGEDEYDADESHAFACFLAGLSELGYGWSYRSLDAQYFGLAQRRERVFVVGYLGDWRRAAAVLFEPASLRGDPAPGRNSGKGTPVGALGGTSPGGGWRFGADEAAAGQLIAADTSPPITHNPYGDHESREGLLVAFGGNNTAGPIDIATAVNAHGGPHGRLDFESETFVAYRTSGNRGAWETGDRIDALTTGTDRTSSILAFDTTQITSASNYSRPAYGDPCHPLAAGAHGQAIAFQSSQSGVREVETHATLDANNGSRRHNGAIVGSAVRRLTPRECERLQGFPGDYTAIPYRNGVAADGPRYKATGNSMAVPCMRWIGRRIAAQHELTSSEAA